MNNPYARMLGVAWQYARGEHRRFVLVYALLVGANLLFALHPVLYGWFVDALQREGGHALGDAWRFAAGYVGLRLAEWCFHGPARVLERHLALRVGFNFLREQFHQVLNLPVQWHQQHHSGATVSRIRKGHDALRDFVQNGFIYVHALVKFFFSFGAMLYFSPLFGCIGVGLGMLTVWVIVTFDKPFVKSLEEVNEREHAVVSALADSLANPLTVIAQHLQARMESGLQRKMQALMAPFRRNVLLNEWKWFTAQLLVASIYAVVALGYVYQHWQPGQTFYIGGLVVLLGYVNQFTSVFNDVAQQYTQVVQYDAEVRAMRYIGEAYRRQPVLPPGAVPPGWQTLGIRHLNFRHGASSRDGPPGAGLHDLRLRLRRGERIALVGESGSGKSTLLALLKGLHLPQPGVCLEADGRAGLSFPHLGSTITLFPQEPELFEDTIRFNITLGAPCTEAELMRVCRVAQFEEVVSQLPHGLDTHIQEKGVNLSGGQRQRLALARGILAAGSSSIVLLDEPTSSVDPATESLVYGELFKEFAGKTVVSSLHRLHLLSRFDYVYLLGNGRIIGEGTFPALRYGSPFAEAILGGRFQPPGAAPGA